MAVGAELYTSYRIVARLRPGASKDILHPWAKFWPPNAGGNMCIT